MEKINTYPVIYITLADIKCATYSDFLEKMRELIKNAYEEYKNVFKELDLTEGSLATINNILAAKPSNAEMSSSIKNLSKYLNEYYGKKAIIIMDEYDTPINESYVNGYYE